ncbi:ArdC family protein [Oceanobacillus zhaokaii]|nr:zincin-like metallopeptidase domain-containing protein [Oceanobacillus zhaokaii]
MDVCEIVTKRIIEKLESGVVPWKKPWNGRGGATRWSVKKPYRGINALLLEPGEYASKKQIIKAGGRINRDQLKNGHIIVYWHWYKIKEEGQEDIPDDEATYQKRAKPFYSRVWDINTQCTGLKSKFNDDDILDFNPIEKAEELISRYEDIPKIKNGPGGAYYIPALDILNMPPVENFHSAEEYYSTLFHELVHSTGHDSRLNREGIIQISSFFGTDSYSKEELIAEMGSCMLSAMAGIDNSTIDNSAAYINGWLSKLKGDKRFIFSAASQAQKAVDYMTGIAFEEEQREEATA